MDDDIIEIHDNEINVEEIMAKIRENIRKRKEGGTYPTDPDLAAPVGSSGARTEIAQDLTYLSGNWNIQNNSYFISSHQPVFGKYLVKGRQLIHGEVCRYVDPVIWKQTEFNRATARVLADQSQYIPEEISRQFLAAVWEIRSILTQRLQEPKHEKQSEILERKEQILDEIAQVIVQLKTEIVQEVKDQIQKEVNQPTTPVNSKGGVDLQPSHPAEKGINYFAFESQFRGSRQDIKNRQNEFLRYFIGCRNVLDIGCGRGEFLEIMQHHGIDARGVDLDETMVEICRIRGLEVALNDAISYLEQLEDESLEGIFIDQVVEHLKPSYLVKLLELCYRKMRSGYYLVAETVNPLSFTSLANFYIDPTHVKPIHPDTLRFLFSNAGFLELEVNFVSPVDKKEGLQKMPAIENGADKIELYRIEVYNKNIEMLNGILYGAQDYMVIGKK